MTRTTIEDIKSRRLAGSTAEQRFSFDAMYKATRLALEVGDKVRDAREAAGLSQPELAARMGTSKAAVARLEAGHVGANIRMLQRVAVVLDLNLTVELSATR